MNMSSHSEGHRFTEDLFIRDVPFHLNFDHILQIRVTPRLISQLEAMGEHKPTLLSSSGHFLPAGIAAFGQLIETALKNRISALDVAIANPPLWSLSDKTLPQEFNGYTTLQFGMTINRAQAFKLVEKCESEEEPIMAAFKEFWGEKSQLRRFRDGTILESVLFDTEKAEHPESHVCFLMLQYVLKKHLGLAISDEELLVKDGVPFGYYLTNQLEKLVDPAYEMIRTNEEGDDGPPKSKKAKKKKKKSKSTPKIQQEIVPTSVDDITRSAIASLDELSRLLRNLEGLPLTITSVQGTSSILRHTNVFPTPPQVFYSSTLLTCRPSPSCHVLQIKEDLQSKIPIYNESIELIVQLEGSGKWPDDLHAIQRLKCAFLLRIAQLLESKYELTVHVYPTKLHVIKNGFIFSIQLTYFRELVLLKQLQGDDGVLRYRDNLESHHREKSTLLLPKLASILHAIHDRFTAFGKTARLVKRWVASHMLLASTQTSHQYQQMRTRDLKQPDYCLNEIAVELIVASLFLNHFPYMEPPNEAQSGFLRFLHLLVHTDWKSHAIILNFNDTLSKEDVRSIESEFTKRRATLPTPFISYPDDRLSSVWTKNLLPIVWKRLIALGKQALEVLETHFKQNACTSGLSGATQLEKLETPQKQLVDPFRTLFKPDLSQFDVLIWIKQSMNCKKRASIASVLNTDGDSNSTTNSSSKTRIQFKEYVKPDEELLPIIDFDPVQSYLVELRQSFGHFGIFLHDTYGGEVIAFVWKPDVLKEHEFKISSVKGQVLRRSSNSTAAGSPTSVVVPNVAGLIELFEVLGEGIVDRVENVKIYEEMKMEEEGPETEP